MWYQCMHENYSLGYIQHRRCMNMSIINLRIYSLYQPLFNIVMTIYYEYIPYSPPTCCFTGRLRYLIILHYLQTPHWELETCWDMLRLVETCWDLSRAVLSVSISCTSVKRSAPRPRCYLLSFIVQAHLT